MSSLIDPTQIKILVIYYDLSHILLCYITLLHIFMHIYSWQLQQNSCTSTTNVDLNAVCTMHVFKLLQLLAVMIDAVKS